jgi:large subunit ribosomal protein L5e
VKVIKNKAYFKRYQTKFRRRREGKTDYYQRRRLVWQDKNKYQTPKYRLVVRFSNKYVVCQIVRAAVEGDKVLSQAWSGELPRYGLKVGLKNYAAAYCTGLLTARRVLEKLGMGELYKGDEEVTGGVEWSHSELGNFYIKDADIDPERRPLRVYLDVGVAATTSGARVFAALKGAVDGGLNIPHNHKRFRTAGGEFSQEAHRDAIFADHVSEYMRQLQEEDPEAYARQFGKYIAEGIGADDLEDLYARVHAAIRADPSPAAKKVYEGPKKKSKKATKKNPKDRANRVKQIKANMYAAFADADEGEESGEESD